MPSAMIESPTPVLVRKSCSSPHRGYLVPSLHLAWAFGVPKTTFLLLHTGSDIVGINQELARGKKKIVMASMLFTVSDNRRDGRISND